MNLRILPPPSDRVKRLALSFGPGVLVAEASVESHSYGRHNSPCERADAWDYTAQGGTDCDVSSHASGGLSDHLADSPISFEVFLLQEVGGQYVLADALEGSSVVRLSLSLRIEGVRALAWLVSDAANRAQKPSSLTLVVA
jgi:hypothetical protein